MKKRLIAKGYPRPIIDNGISKAMSLDRTTIINGNAAPTDENQSKPIYFVSTHNTLIDAKSTGSGIQSTVSGLNTARPDRQPISIKHSFRKSPSLKDQLMYRPLCNRKVQKCGKNCIFCNYLHEGDSIRLKNGMTVTCNGNFECTSRNVVYIATCSAVVVKKVTWAKLEMSYNLAGWCTGSRLNCNPDMRQSKPMFI